MRNLFLFLWNHQFTILFILLETVGISLLATSNSFHQSVVHERATAVAGTVYNWQYLYKRYLGLRDENRLLRQENAQLREHQFGTETVSGGIPYKCVSASAIQSTWHLGSNYVIINRGQAHGIKPQSGVIGPAGVVGVVHTVAEHYSSILPLIHQQSQLSARLAKNEYFGIVQWNGTDERYALLTDIPNHVPVAAGDTVVTRGSGGVFPAAVPVGYVHSTEADESSGFQNITIELATDFRSLATVYVLMNDFKPEVDSLIKKAEQWNVQP